MTIEKLPSGSYRIKKQVNGKRYTVTVDHKPTQKEAITLMADILSEKTTISSDMPFNLACKAYIESRMNILSPSSIRRYYQYTESLSEGLAKTRLNSITKPMIQEEVNLFSKDHAPKTTHNYIGFITAVLNYFGNNIGRLTLPQKERKTPYIPTEEEVFAICNEVKDTMFEIPILLASYGLRRSEVCCLTLNDIDFENNMVHVNKALVQNENKEWVIKPIPKTSKSTRSVPVDEYIINLIKEKGVVYDGFPGSIYNHLCLVEKKLGIEHFSLHKFRHFFASYLHKQGVRDSIIEDLGGWDTGIWKDVYRHSLELEQKKKEASAALSNVILKR